MVGIGVFFFVGGLNAMLIRTELLQPNVHAFGANQYLTLVGMHGSMMMGIMTSGILGPFANWVVPLMIGSRRMAFPRIESFTFWLLMAGAVILVTTIFFGGFQTGWTGYQPLGAQGTAGYDAYIGFFALVGLSMTLFGFNLVATIVTMRAPGMTWSRLPIFVWATFSTAILMLLAAPMLIAALLMGAMDRTVQTALLYRRRGRQLIPVPEPVLGVRPPGGVHPGAARVRDRARAAAGVRAQAALGVPAGGSRDARRGLPELLRLAAPLVRVRHQRRPAAVLHALDRADLAADGIHLPLRDGDAVARANTVHGADAVLPGVGVQLPLGRDLGRVQLRRPERRDHARQLLRDGALPLHDHGWTGVRLLRRDLLLGAEDVRVQAQRAPWQDPFLGRCSSPSTRRSRRCSGSASWGCPDAW